MPPLKLTVATVTYNAGHLVSRTIHSVEAQDYPFVEHLLIDGNSQDDTLEHVHHYQERNSNALHKREIVCLSEPDEGLYDAMNKALEMATGQYILFLNAGDTFHSTDTLSRMAHAIEESRTAPAVVYGDTNLVDSEGRFVRRRRLTPPPRLSWHSFKNGMLVCHQAFMAQTALCREIRYDRKYRFSADFDWCIRIMKQAASNHQPLVNARCIVADYLEEGMTTKNHKASLRERFHIMTRHYGLLPTVMRHAWFVVRKLTKK